MGLPVARKTYLFKVLCTELLQVESKASFRWTFVGFRLAPTHTPTAQPRQNQKASRYAMVPAQEPYHRDHALVVGVYRASKKKMLGTQQSGT